MPDATATEIFTATSVFSTAGVFGVLALAYVGLVKLLPKTASKMDRFTFVWLVSDSNLNRVNVSWGTESLTSCIRHSTR